MMSFLLISPPFYPFTKLKRYGFEIASPLNGSTQTILSVSLPNSWLRWLAGRSRSMLPSA
jgi:hypothetical protein